MARRIVDMLHIYAEISSTILRYFSVSDHVLKATLMDI
jgi:hypothetical protein